MSVSFAETILCVPDVGVITFLQAVLFALAGEYRYSLIFLLCLLLLRSGPERQLCRTLKEQERGDTRPGYVWKSALQEMSFTVPVGSHIDDGEHHKINRLSRFFYSFLVITFCLAKLMYS